MVRGAILAYWWTLRAVVAPFALLSGRLRNLYGRAFLQDRSGKDLSTSPEVVRCAREDLWQLCGQTLVLGTSFAAGLPVVELYLIPLLVAGVLNARRVIIEHTWHENFDRSRETVLATTLDHDLGPSLNALLYPHGIGWHRAHHIYPRASFAHLRRLTGEIAVGDSVKDETSRSGPRDRFRE